MATVDAETPQSPVRTCIGCRQRAAAAELLRVVVAPDVIGRAANHAEEARSPSAQLGRGPVTLPVVPDPRRRTAGRGAWLHPDSRCVDLAERRRAFARALRVPGPVDPTPVREYVAQANSVGSSSTTPPAEPRRR